MADEFCIYPIYKWSIYQMINKKSQTGFITRIIASVIIVVSLPFLITNPNNIIAIIAFAFGDFLLVLGGLID